MLPLVCRISAISSAAGAVAVAPVGSPPNLGHSRLHSSPRAAPGYRQSRAVSRAQFCALRRAKQDARICVAKEKKEIPRTDMPGSMAPPSRQLTPRENSQSRAIRSEARSPQRRLDECRLMPTRLPSRALAAAENRSSLGFQPRERSLRGRAVSEMQDVEKSVNGLQCHSSSPLPPGFPNECAIPFAVYGTDFDMYPTAYSRWRSFVAPASVQCRSSSADCRQRLFSSGGSPARKFRMTFSITAAKSSR